ncbi:MAG: hypothetical protein WD227_11455, partial [Vicinamibacterales bacterium]
MHRDQRAALPFVLPALTAIALVAIAPMLWTLWESVHLHDLRMPWLGQPFIGLDNYAEAFGDPRFLDAALHTAAFVVGSVALELLLGLVFALAMNRAWRGRALIRVVVLMSWAV